MTSAGAIVGSEFSSSSDRTENRPAKLNRPVKIISLTDRMLNDVIHGCIVKNDGWADCNGD